MRTALALILLLLAVGTASADLADGPLHTILWNRVDRVVVADSMAISPSETAISVARWNDSLRMFVTERVVPTPFHPVGARLIDSLLVVKTDDFRLAAYDVRELPELELQWLTDPGIAFADYMVAGGSLYLSAWFDGLWRYSVDPAGTLTFLDSSMAGIMLTQLAADAQYLYVLDEYNGIMRYDPTLGGSDAFVDYLYVPSEVSAFVLDGTEVTMLVRQGGMILGDMGGETPVLGATVGGIIRPRKIYASGEEIVAVMARSIDVRDRATGSLLSSLTVSGIGTEGAAFTSDSGRYIVLPQADGGLYLFDIDHPMRSGDGLYRSGPVQSLAFIGGKLVTGGGGNPIDVYSFDSTLAPTLDYTMFPELTGVQSILPVGDSLIAYYAGINRVAFILDALRPDSFFLERSFALSDTLSGRMQFLPRLRDDTLRGVVVPGEFALQAYAINDSGLITPLTPWKQSARIASSVVSDTLVFTGTLKRQLIVQRIDSALQLQTVVGFDLPNLPTALYWLKDRLLVFGPDRLAVYVLSEFGTLEFTGEQDLPMTVLGLAEANERLYAIGSAGIAVFDVDSVMPELIEFGGNPGRLIAVSGPVLAASDGGSVEIYRVDANDTGGTPVVPREYVLYQNYPNPFNGETVIRYGVPRAGRVKLTIYNMLGQEVTRLVDGERAAGIHQAVWDGTDRGGRQVASGVYLYRVEAGSVSESKKMVLVK